MSQKSQFVNPDLEPVQVGQAIVDALNSGLSQHIIKPGFANVFPFVSRGPAWLKRLVELVSGDNSL